LRSATGDSISGGGPPGQRDGVSANHTSQLPEKLVTLGIWMEMV
jgi:hypothetical protein